jgi:hypothetical protein
MLNTQLSFSWENISFMFLVLVHRLLIRWSSCPRPSSTPFVSGDSFRMLADHVYEEGNVDLDPSRVKEKDIIFVQLTVAEHFFKHIHPGIKKRYLLILHNGDQSFGQAWVKYIDRKIIAVFSQNVKVKHSKVTPLPIGLENYWYYNHGVPSLFTDLQKQLIRKKNAILYGFSVSTNKTERLPAQKYISRHPAAVSVPDRFNSRRYLQYLAKHKFVLSPPGNGIDCIRTWEAMYVDVIPIVKRSVATEYFFSLGLPIWLVNDWKELDGYTPARLARKYNDLMSKANTSALYFGYWKYRIEQQAA